MALFKGHKTAYSKQVERVLMDRKSVEKAPITINTQAEASQVNHALYPKYRYEV